MVVEASVTSSVFSLSDLNGRRAEIAAWPLSGATYVVHSKLGQGTFGAVYAAWRQSNWEKPAAVALKVTPRHSLQSSRELEIMLLLRRHPHRAVLPLDEFFCIPSMARTSRVNMLMCQVMPLCACSLRDYILQTVAKLELPQRMASARHIGAAIAAGLVHLHSLHIAHRDMKPENVLVRRSDSSPASIQCLIADFGCSKKIPVDSDGCSAEPSCCLVVSPIYVSHWDLNPLVPELS